MTHNKHVEDTAKILRGFREKIERLEQKNRRAAAVQQYRELSESVIVADSTLHEVRNERGFIFNQSKWGFDEFGKGSVTTEYVDSDGAFGQSSFGGTSFGGVEEGGYSTIYGDSYGD